MFYLSWFHRTIARNFIPCIAMMSIHYCRYHPTTIFHILFAGILLLMSDQPTERRTLEPTVWTNEARRSTTKGILCTNHLWLPAFFINTTHDIPERTGHPMTLLWAFAASGDGCQAEALQVLLAQPCQDDTSRWISIWPPQEGSSMWPPRMVYQGQWWWYLIMADDSMLNWCKVVNG